MQECMGFDIPLHHVMKKYMCHSIGLRILIKYMGNNRGRYIKLSVSTKYDRIDT